MKKVDYIWTISLLIILFLGINYLVSGKSEIANFIFGILLTQIILFIIYKSLTFYWTNKNKP